MNDELQLLDLAPDVLRTFVCAADAGSFTQAGTLVHRTQSAVSMQMKRLEEDLGRPLFLRQGRGVSLTEDGETLYRYAQRMLELHEEALAALAAPRLGGVVRVGAPEDYAAQFLPRTLKRFSAVHPDVEVQVYCDATPDLISQFAAGNLDVMLTTEEYGEGPNRRKLGLVWIVAEDGGPLRKRPLPLALFHSGCPYRRNALLSLEEAGMAYRIAYSSPSMAGVLAAVQAGLAIAPATENFQAPGCRRTTSRDGIPPIAPVSVGLHLANGTKNEAAASFHSFIANVLHIDI
ncbi:LysR family transcriptional regulator [Pseudodesulfovibrio sp.]|uniref:LysR family transcriptional regulator n=1 Tax=unclassified Pseudodesulfovibrio TaxID=2661612 RepID=UPI003B0058AB